MMAVGTCWMDRLTHGMLLFSCCRYLSDNSTGNCTVMCPAGENNDLAAQLASSIASEFDVRERTNNPSNATTTKVCAHA